MATETVIDRLVTELLYKTDDRSLKKFGQRIDALKAKAQRLSGITLAAGAALTAAAGGNLKAFAGYEKGWLEMAAKTGEIATELEDRYGSAVQEIARQTGVSMEEVQRGFQKGLSAGLEGQELIDAVTAATKSQAAGIGNLEETLSSATTAWSVLGIEADAAMDIITKAAQKGEGETSDFGNALKGLVGFTDTLALDFEETAAALAAVSQNAKSVAIGETQLRGFFKAIADPSEQAIKALDELNAEFDFGDLRKSMDEEGLAKTFGTMKTWIEDLKAAGVDTAPIIGSLFPEVEAQQFFTTVDPQKIADLEKEMRLAAGTIQDAFVQGVHGVTRNWNQMMQQLKQVAVVLGEQLAPAFLDLTDWVEKAVDWFLNLDSGTQELIGQLGLLGPALLAVGVALQGFAIALGGLAILIGPAGWVVLGIAAVSAALVAMTVYWEEITAAMDAAKAKFLAVTESWGISSDVFGWIRDAWVSLLNFIASPIEGLWAWISEGANPFQVMLDRYMVFANIITKPLVISFGWMVDAWGSAMQWMDGKWEGLIGFVAGAFDIGFDWLTDAWRGAIDWMGDQWREFIAWMTGFIPAPILHLVERGREITARAEQDSFGNEALEGLPATPQPRPLLSPPVSPPAETRTTPEQGSPTSAIQPVTGGGTALAAPTPPVAETPVLAAPQLAATPSPRGLGGRGGPRNVNVEIREVNIQAEGADAESLYGDASRKLGQELQTSFEGLDSPILR